MLCIMHRCLFSSLAPKFKFLVVVRPATTVFTNAEKLVTLYTSKDCLGQFVWIVLLFN